jgi:uridine phosphorylase
MPRQEAAARSYPNYPGKHSLRAFVNPTDTIDYVRTHGDLDAFSTLKGVILTYQRSILDHVFTAEGLDPATTERGFRGILTLPSTDHEIGVLGAFGFGAPVATFLLENFIALGTSRFISIGTAGGLQPGCQAGDLVLCDRAIRDEGVSHHYVLSAKYAEPSKSLTGALARELGRANLTFSTGTSWTIDTPYRESVDEARQYRREGVLCVEMEAAALFTVAAFRSAQIASAFVISDLLDAEAWDPQMRHDATTQSLNHLYRASLSTLEATGDR